MTFSYHQYPTPYYLYNLSILQNTLDTCLQYAQEHFQLHYALKANGDEKVLKIIQKAGLGADCVSGNEIKKAIEIGFPKEKILFAGVGKKDWEILLAIQENIGCLIIESIHEAKIIQQLCKDQNKQLNIAIRIAPNIDIGGQSPYIVTGTQSNKFGILWEEIDTFIDLVKSSNHLIWKGIHFHIGSQITNHKIFEQLSKKAIWMKNYINAQGIAIAFVNVGGGLGINYQTRDQMADFKSYFDTFNNFFPVQQDFKVYFELGRSLVAQMGSLISSVLFEKQRGEKKFLIIDASMNDLIRPALYKMEHHIEKVYPTASDKVNIYEVVGPICESSDCFGKEIALLTCSRNDLVKIGAAGAYARVLSSQYNMRDISPVYYIE